MEEKKQAVIAPNHYLPSEFAKAKNVDRLTVRNHILAGKIVPDLVGYGKTKMIDFNIYKDYTFAEPKFTKKSLRKQIESEK